MLVVAAIGWQLRGINKQPGGSGTAGRSLGAVRGLLGVDCLETWR